MNSAAYPAFGTSPWDGVLKTYIDTGDNPIPSYPGPVLNLLPKNYQKWRNALAKVRAGSGAATLWCCGDSTTEGIVSFTGTYPYLLTKLLNSYHVPAAITWGVATANGDTTAADPRFGLGTGWSSVTNGYFQSSTTNALSFTPSSVAMGPQTVDSVDIYYIAGSGFGSFNTNVNGGASLGTTNTNGAQALLKASFTFTSTSAPTLNIVPTSTSPVLIVAVNSYLSTSPVVQVANMGASGSTAAQWSTAPFGMGFYQAAMFYTYRPDLAILDLGVNDAGASTAAATYQGYMQTIITRQQGAGDVLLKSMVPSANTPYTTYEALYQPVLQTLATNNNLGLIDVNSRWGNSYSSVPATWYQDTLHPTAVGNGDIAEAVFNAVKVI